MWVLGVHARPGMCHQASVEQAVHSFTECPHAQACATRQVQSKQGAPSRSVHMPRHVPPSKCRASRVLLQGLHMCPDMCCQAHSGNAIVRAAATGRPAMHLLSIRSAVPALASALPAAIVALTVGPGYAICSSCSCRCRWTK